MLKRFALPIIAAIAPLAAPVTVVTGTAVLTAAPAEAQRLRVQRRPFDRDYRHRPTALKRALDRRRRLFCQRIADRARAAKQALRSLPLNHQLRPAAEQTYALAYRDFFYTYHYCPRLLPRSVWGFMLGDPLTRPPWTNPSAY